MKSFLRIFAVIYVPIVLILLWAFAHTYSMMVESATNELKEEIRNQWTILSQFKDDVAFDLDRHRQYQAISQNTRLRITLVRPDGVVMDDSYLSAEEILEMENHRDRQEIITAIVRGEGFSQRYSNTIKMDMMYYARPLPNNMVLRIAYPMTYVQSIHRDWQQYVITVLIFLLVVIGLISLYFARQISRPLQQLDSVAEAVETNQPDIHFPEFRNPSMARVSGLLYRIYTSMLENQKDLRAEQQKMNQILATLDEAILLLDEHHVVIKSNQQVERLLGTPLNTGDNVLEKPSDAGLISFFRTILHADEQYFSRMELGGRFFEVYVRNIGRNILIVMHDITDQGRYDVYKSELIGNITHELKTPMASIQGYAETLISNPDLDPDSRNRFLHIIFSHTRRLNNLISDILELHTLESLGEVVKVEEPVALDDLKSELMAHYNDMKETVHLSFDAGRIGVRHEHLTSIITNLVDNAIKYGDANRVDVVLGCNKDEIRIDVLDGGPVIPESERERIFERFYTLSKSRNRNNAGTGLGLSIVKHISRIYGGTAAVTENDRGGNRFTVILRQQN